MRSIEGLFVMLGSLMWGVAFYYGINASSWKFGEWGLMLIALALVLRVVEFLIPNRKPKPKQPKIRNRKCPVCGKPATSGSDFCSYHAKYGPEDGRR